MTAAPKKHDVPALAALALAALYVGFYGRAGCAL